MTTTSRLAIVGLLVLSLIGGGIVGPAAAQTGPQTEAAELAISQPHYADGDVQQSTSNGTVVYEAGAAPIEIAPQNFDAANVVDWGVETQGGNAELTYDREFDEFEFSADADGTYELYWSVEREIRVQNESGNGTHIETESQRYTALVRLSGLTEMVHQPAGELDQTRQQAEKWQEWNATVAEVQDTIGTSLPVKVGLAEPPSTQETLQGMVNAYLTFRAPLHMLTGQLHPDSHLGQHDPRRVALRGDDHRAAAGDHRRACLPIQPLRDHRSRRGETLEARRRTAAAGGSEAARERAAHRHLGR